uniref:RRM domain-containing protein n=1 Tax=Panagrolaimus sp. JU765 TaxID=591449 RepID=A0AC34QP99_9BILA
MESTEETVATVDNELQVPNEEPASQEDVKTKSFYVRLRGLPYAAKEPEIRQFFDGLNVDEVQIITGHDGRASGEAFVGFATTNDADQAMSRDKNKVGTRYVEVFRVTEPEFARIRSRNTTSGPPGAFGPYIPSGAGYMGRPPNGAVIRVRGLPYSCKQNELVNFFKGLNVEEVVFGKEPGEGGRPTGEAYVKFASNEEAEQAMQFNGQHLGKRYLELFLSDSEQFERFKRQITTPVQPLINSYNYDWNQWYGGQEDYYGWDAYNQPAPPIPVGAGRPRGGYRGSHHHGGMYREAARPTPYDYHGRVYGDPNMAAAYGAYDYGAYGGYPMPQPTEPIGNKIHVRGLPFRVSASQIMDFFSPLQCVEIKLGYLPDGRASGDGIIEFGSPEDTQEAMRRDRQMIGNRYIEIFGPNTMKVAPGTTYKRIGGSSRPPPLTTAAYQW